MGGAIVDGEQSCKIWRENYSAKTLKSTVNQSTIKRADFSAFGQFWSSVTFCSSDMGVVLTIKIPMLTFYTTLLQVTMAQYSANENHNTDITEHFHPQKPRSQNLYCLLFQDHVDRAVSVARLFMQQPVQVLKCEI